MKIVGITAEYNPFHAGHAYQIAEAKRLSGADCCVAVMSGYFVQRGEPAVYDPYTRARAALEQGADAVIAMPALFSCASAELFAGCGAGMLDDLGCDAISFGAESWDAKLYGEIVRIISDEPESYREALRKRLKAGESYAAARVEAVRACLPESMRSAAMPNQPNQILALEYCRALRAAGSSMEIVPVERVGHGYHDEWLYGEYDDLGAMQMVKERTENGTEAESENKTVKTGTMEQKICKPAASPAMDEYGYGRQSAYKSACIYPSATALRRRLREEGADGCLFTEDIWSMMLSVIMRKLRDGDDLTEYADVSPEIASRIAALMGRECCGSFDAFVKALKTRQYAYTRIARSLMHIFLDHRAEDVERAREGGRYALLLGMRKDASGLMAELKRRSRIPIIAKAADAKSILRSRGEPGRSGSSDIPTGAGSCDRCPAGSVQAPYSKPLDNIRMMKMFENDVYASRLYAAAYMCKYGRELPDIYRSRVVVL